MSVLPTPVFLYGLPRDDELFVDIERGKTLVIRYLATGEADEEGRRTIFFELNGQPREVKVADRSLAPSGAVRRMADEGNPGHVAAPMPGLVVAVPVREGDVVRRGDPPAVDRGDEDGDRRLRRPRRDRDRGARDGRDPGRDQAAHDGDRRSGGERRRRREDAGEEPAEDAGEQPAEKEG